MKSLDITGAVFSRLTVVKQAPNKNGRTQWYCLCECGGTVTTYTKTLLSGGTQSCGCLRLGKAKNVTHGHTQGARSDTYRSWEGMKNRCLNPNYSRYSDYGGRGITVCERWMVFANFLEDMGERPPGKSLDRVDNLVGYTPENCKWSTAKEQAANRRPRSANKGVLK